MPQNAAPLRHVVTAVVVAHDAARLLPALVQAVHAQTHPVHRVVGVDTGSQDRSGAALTELLGQDAVFGMEADTGFGAAVASALQHRAPRRAAQKARDAEWIWLLHDDCEPAADALEQLLSAAGRSRSLAVLGPKLKDASDRRVVREAGVTTDRAGRRLTGVEPGEIDQGQHDGDRAVVAVSSAGMLVRRDVWDQLGGFDPNLPLFRDDIDFCWRAHAAGFEVRVVTDAVVYHRELAARQIRATSGPGGHPRLLDRRGALYVFAVNLPLWPMLTVVGGCLAGSLVRAAYFLLTKQQRKAAAHLGAVAWLLRHPLVLRRERRRRAGDRKHGYAVLRGELPRARTLGRLLETVAGLPSRGSGYDRGGLHHAAVDEPGDDLPLPAADSVVRRVLTSPGVLLFAGLAVVALVAERSLTGSVLSGSVVLGGGALVPPWGGAGGLWHEYLAGYHDTGIGSTASTSPYVGVMAVLATVFGGKPWLATDVLLLGCVPLAGTTAFLATRRLTSLLAVRLWIAASYALLPVATGAVAAGRIGTAVAFVLLPVIGGAVGRMLTGTPRSARRAAWAAGLLTAIVAAFVPLAWPLAVIAALGAAAPWRWLGPRTVGSAASGDAPAGLAASGGGPVPPRGFAVNAAIVAAVPAVLLVPWTLRLVTSPSLFFAEAGLVRPGLAVARLRPESLLLLSPGGPGLPPAWVTAGLVLPAFCALFTRRRPALVYTGWGIALAGLVAALAVSRVRLTPPQGGPAASAWPGLALAAAAAGLLLAATPLMEAIARTLARAGHPGAGHPGAGQPGAGQPGAGRLGTGGRLVATVAGLAVAVSVPALAAGYWLADGLGGPVAAVGPPILPPFVAASSAGPDRDRTLVLRDEGGGQDGGTLSYAVLRDADPVLGEPELAENTASTHAMESVVASLVAAGGGDAGDTGQALSQFDIGYVLLPAPVDQTLAVQLNAAAGLEPLTQAPSYDLWQVSGTVARVRVITPGGTTIPVPSGSIGVNTVVAPGTSGTLVLAEAAGGWSATLNGKPLTPLAAPVDGWAQGFALPPGGGHLVITRDETARDVSLGCEAAALLIAAALALPGTRTPAAEAGAGAVPVTGRRRERAEAARSARRKRRPQVTPAGAPADGAASADDARAGVGPATGTAGASFGPDPGPEYATVGAGHAPVYTAEPALSVAPHLEEGHPPWEGPAQGKTGTQGRHDPAPAPTAPPTAPPAAPRRGRSGQHAARHGKPVRRRREGSEDRGDLP